MKRGDKFPLLDAPTTELQGEGNVVVFKDILENSGTGKTLTFDTEVWYNWRVDCVEGATNKRRKGKVWRFLFKSNEGK